jgi:hypothetical protein
MSILAWLSLWDLSDDNSVEGQCLSEIMDHQGFLEMISYVP